MSEKSPTFTRRSFLGLLAAGTASVAAGFVYTKRTAIRLVADKLRHNTSPYRLDEAAPAGALPEADMANILSLAGVLIPWDEGAATVRDMTREFVDGQCRFEPGSRSAYLGVSDLLDRAADGARFADLDGERREQIVAALIGAPIRSRRDWRHVYNVLFRYEETRATELVVNAILMNFYGDDRSWDYLGAA